MEPERSEVSVQEVKTFLVLYNSKEWQTNTEITAKVKGVSTRAIRNYTKKFLDLGLLDVAEVFPAHKYKWAEKAEKRNTAYLNRLLKARVVFGL